MRERVLPEIDVKSHVFSGPHKCSGVRKSLQIPCERAGVCMRLPSGFKAKHIARDAALAQSLCQSKDMLRIEVHLSSIPKAEAPLRGQHTPTRKQVVSLHRLPQLRTSE